MDQDTLRQLGIRSWEDISSEFKQADLLLGNGFSLNFSNVFNYKSLFEEFLADCTPQEIDLFSSFDTTNFESIQEQLVNARKINELFKIPTDPIDPAVEKLRQGLITSVNNNHPVASDIDPEMLYETSIALDPFEDVFTLNYDLFLYRIIMASKDLSQSTSIKRHNDYFWDEHDAELLEFRDFDNSGSKHVYYLHGALFIFPGYQFDYYNDLKIRRGNEPFDELIAVVAKKIERGTLPLFVSEGTSKDKRRAISRSPYLAFAYRKLEESRRSLVIYGWSASTQDNHILGALNPRRSPARRPLAVSIYVGERSKVELEKEVAFLKSRLSGHHVRFFDSSILFVL